jgi:tRNAHis guanylyltransferase
MKFDDLDAKMRVYETSHDHCVLPGLYMVARLDGRSFTRLTKDVHQFEAPFDVRFRDIMLETTEHLMRDCGFNVTYGQAPEIEFRPRRGSERQVLAAPRFSRLLRLPDFATAERRSGHRLFPLAERGRAPQCFECPLLLDGPKTGEECWGRHRRTRRKIGIPKERIALPKRDQLQRSPALAKARLRCVLAIVRASRQEPAHRRRGRRPAPASAP